MVKPDNNKGIILWLFLVVLSAYAVVANGHYGGDALNNYLTAESLVLDRDLSIYDRAFPVQEIQMGQSRGVVGRDGKSYSPFGIGIPLLQTPLFLIGLLISKIFKALPTGYVTFFCVSFTNTVLSAINTVLLFILMVHLGFDRKKAVFLSLIYSFSTTAIVYSKTGFTEPGLTTFLLLAILSLFAYFKNQKDIYLIICGATLGFMGLIKSYTIILCPAFALYFLMVEKKRRINIWLPALSYLAVFSIELWLNYLKFGGILKTGYGNAAVFGLNYGSHFVKALYYYWLSTGKGFFFYNLPLLLGVFSWPIFRSKSRRESWLICSVLFTYTVYFAYLFKRGSIFSWGPRYLFPITPLFILFMEGVFRKKILVWLLVVMAAGGLLVQLPAAIMNYSGYLNFVIEKLGVDEYLINFVPELSPIKGCWQLLISSLERTLCGAEYLFVYSPDSMFVKPVSGVMTGYDNVDLWYVNLVRFNKDLRMVSILGVVFVLVFCIFSGAMLFRRIRGAL